MVVLGWTLLELNVDCIETGLFSDIIFIIKLYNNGKKTCLRYKGLLATGAWRAISRLSDVTAKPHLT